MSLSCKYYGQMDPCVGWLVSHHPAPHQSDSTHSESCTNRVLRNNRHVKLIPLREKQSLKTSLSFPFSSPYTDTHHSPHDFLRFGHHDCLLPKKSVVSVWGRFYSRRESKQNLERNLIK